jgi:PAS domain S-box-containing protein
MKIPGTDAYCIVDENAHVIYSSRAFNSLFGFDDSELIKKDLYTLTHPDDRETLCKLLTNGVADRNEYVFTIRAHTKDEKYIQCHGKGSLLFDKGTGGRHAIIHVYSSVDNNNSLGTESDLDYKFRILFDHTYDAIFLMKDDMFVECNLRAEVLFGYSREELLQKKPYYFSPPVQPDGRNSREKALEKITKALRGIPQSFEWTHRRKDGVRIDTEVNLNRIDLNGDVLLQAIVRDITKRKETEAELRYRVNFEKFIASITANFINLAPHEIDNGIRNTLEDIGIFAGVDRSFVFLFDETGNEYSVAHEWCNDGIFSIRSRRQSIHADDIPWWHGKLIRFENVRIADVSNLPVAAAKEKSILRSIGSQSLLCTPLRIGKSLIGFFGFDTHVTKTHWSMESMTLLRIIGEIIANALERQHRDEELRRLADQRKHLLEISTSMLSTLNPDEVVRQTLGVLNEIIRFDECGIHLLDEKNKILRPHAIVDSLGNAIEAQKNGIPLSKGVLGSVIQSGKAELVNNAHEDPRSSYQPGYRYQREHMICVPMNTKNTVLGTFTVIRHDDSQFSTEEFELVQLFVGYATVAIENAQLYQAIQGKNDVTAALLQTALSIVEQKDVRKVLSLIAEQSMRITHVDRCAVFLWNDVLERFDPVVVITPPGKSIPDVDKLAVKPGDVAVIKDLMRHNSPIIVNEDRVKELLTESLVESCGIKTMLVIPFFKGGTLLGGMTLDDTREARTFTEEDLNSAVGIANQASVAIENARLFEQIKASEERYRSLFEESKDGVFTSTEDGHIIDINPAGVEMLGYNSKEELQNVNIATEIYQSPQRREEYKTLLRTHGYVKDFEAILKRKDGKKITCLMTSTIFCDDKTGKLLYRGFMRDVTDRKMLEDKLRQTQKMESLGQLAGGIAHDFNNVLGIVQASLSALKGKLTDSDNGLHKYVEMGENAVMRGADVARRLLTFSQSHEVRLVPLTIADVVKDLIDVLKYTIEKDISIQSRVAPNVPPIQGDHGQVYQMLLNLCLNARDAIAEHTGNMVDGYINITVDEITKDELPSSCPTPVADHYLKLSVEDNGGGMPESVREKVFDPFFTTKTTGKGTGLGLSVVYGIVQTHDGFIDVQTKLGEGTTFSVYFPASAGSEPVESNTDYEMITGGNESILVVEDEDILRTLMEEILKSKGYTVTSAADGMTALEVFRERHDEIDAIILDMGLPKLSGQVLFLKMKQIDPSSNIILASGYVDEAMRQNLFELGAKAFVQKPYKAYEILQSVRLTLDEQKHIDIIE